MWQIQSAVYIKPSGHTMNISLHPPLDPLWTEDKAEIISILYSTCSVSDDLWLWSGDNIWFCIMSTFTLYWCIKTLRFYLQDFYYFYTVNQLLLLKHLSTLVMKLQHETHLKSEKIQITHLLKYSWVAALTCCTLICVCILIICGPIVREQRHQRAHPAPQSPVSSQRDKRVCVRVWMCL